MSNKYRYHQFCEQEKIHIFSQPLWLDVVCGPDNWDVILVEKGGEVWASMPYYYKRKGPFFVINMPTLTQKMGPHIKYPKGQSYYKRLSWEKEIMFELIEQLPKFDYFVQQWDYKYTNWLPFYWKGFSQTTRYTYIIESDGVSKVEKEAINDVKRRIKKAQDQGIFIDENGDITDFYKLNKKTFERRGMEVPYSFDLLNKVYNSLKIQNKVKLILARGISGNTIAGGLFVFDKESVYYIAGGIDPDFSEIGAMNLVIFKGIEFAIENKLKFDFEGSMVESIERYFRSFGAKQFPYFRIYKMNNVIIKFMMSLKS